MKKLLKSEICGFVNSAWVHYSQLTCQQLRAEQKKKNKKEKCRLQNANTKLI